MGWKQCEPDSQWVLASYCYSEAHFLRAFAPLPLLPQQRIWELVVQTAWGERVVLAIFGFDFLLRGV